ncbi:unnamed protein product [Leptidea sinapis]|uniref:Uncharacterized protein n=1 Tax=Leptidea sinapis TaxID=189913 RepID=A0A5E4R3L6_9NEOP|nr:unnamed protein product [Leptidea sinapis]
MTATSHQTHPWRPRHSTNTAGMAAYLLKLKGHQGGRATFTMPWQLIWIHHGNDRHTSREDTKSIPQHLPFILRKPYHNRVNTLKDPGGMLVVRNVTPRIPEFQRGSPHTGKKYALTPCVL